MSQASPRPADLLAPERLALHLADPFTSSARRCGTLSVERRDGRGTRLGRDDAGRWCYVLEAEPAVLEMAKRLFPGSVTGRRNEVCVVATPRATEDLNWFLLRYPMACTPEAEAFFQAARTPAIEHARRREGYGEIRPAAPPPTFTGTLYPFQAEAVASLLALRHTLLRLPMGSGKSVIGCAALATADAFPALVVVPPQITRQWHSVLQHFLAPPVLDAQLGLPLGPPSPGTVALAPPEKGARHGVSHVIRGLKPYALPPCPVHIIHYGLLRGWKHVLPEIGYKAVLFDEIQELRHTGTEKYSAASLLAERTEFVWGLSGTPIHGYGGEMWAVINILEFLALGSWDAFTREWCMGYGDKRLREPVVLGDHLRREGLMVHRHDDEVLAGLPPARHITHVVGKDDKVYGQLIREAVTLAGRYHSVTDWAEKGRMKRDIDRVSRQATGIAKAPEAAAFIRGLVEAGERVLVFAHHHAVHDILCEELAAYAPGRVTGGESAAAKAEAIRRFVDGETPILDLALRSASGLDGLQGRATVIVFAELDWAPAVHAQCVGRLRRMGMSEGLAAVLAYYLVTDSGSDETMQEALGLKVSQYTGLLGEQPESEEDRLLASADADRHMNRVIESLRRLGAERQAA